MKVAPAYLTWLKSNLDGIFEVDDLLDIFDVMTWRQDVDAPLMYCNCVGVRIFGAVLEMFLCGVIGVRVVSWL